MAEELQLWEPPRESWLARCVYAWFRPSYIYTPLNPKWQGFRVLKVHPRQSSDAIKAVLWPSGFKVLPRPRYETISYCWGDASQTKVIEVNGHAMPVPATAAAAIRRLRLSDRIRHHWIDAICINQSDSRERAEQVKLMSKIYSESYGNCIYLGEGDESTASALESIDLLNAQLVQAAARLDVNETALSPVARALTHRMSELTSVQGAHDIDTIPLRKLFSLSWFR